MEVEIPIVEEDVGTNNSIEEEVEEAEGGAFKEEMFIWRSKRERINNALAAARNVEKQDPAEVSAAAQSLGVIIIKADVEDFISEMESLAMKINPSAIFNCLNAEGNSLLHFAAINGKDDILRLLLDYVPDHLIAAQNDWGDTPLHMAIGDKRYTAAEMLIRRARDLPNIEDKNQILRMKNKHGNTALHEAVHNGHVKGVRDLLNEDLEPVYWTNDYQTSPLYLAVDSKEPEIQQVLFSLALEPSRIQSLPPIHSAILQERYGKLLNLFIGNIYVQTDLVPNPCSNFLPLPKPLWVST